ncbi:hypothetical protein [Paraburkholderia sp.]|jgi:threonine dehydrogenase-like Zn-dependent dehydrogenase|uniref:hypothetical protein n=1 Tax=Paraburkholderia sp. TaxID=1926495 RepID=UPI003C7D067B
MTSTDELLRRTQDETMRAALQTGLRSMEMVTMPIPEALPGTVIIKVASIGICGSDLLARKGDALRAMITHDLSLDDIQEAFRLAADKSSESIKVQVRT